MEQVKCCQLATKNYQFRPRTRGTSASQICEAVTQVEFRPRTRGTSACFAHGAINTGIPSAYLYCFGNVVFCCVSRFRLISVLSKARFCEVFPFAEKCLFLFLFFSIPSCSKFEPSFGSASDAFPAFWRENATDATGATNKHISSAIVERPKRF